MQNFGNKLVKYIYTFKNEYFILGYGQVSMAWISLYIYFSGLPAW